MLEILRCKGYIFTLLLVKYSYTQRKDITFNRL